MITISNNDLKQLLLYVQATGGLSELRQAEDLRLYNRVRLAKNTVCKLMKRQDVQLVMSGRSGSVVADK